MKFSNLSKVFELEDGVPMLVHLENEGDDTTIHFVVWPDDLGTITLGLTGPASIMEERFNELDQEGAQALFSNQIKPMLDAALGHTEKEN